MSLSSSISGGLFLLGDIMNTCQNCVNWKSYEGHTTPDETATRTWKICERTMSGGGIRDDQQSKAVAIDGEGYGSMLYTAPDFGCNQFEQKG